MPQPRKKNNEPARKRPIKNAQVPQAKQSRFSRLYHSRQLPQALELAHQLVNDYPEGRFAWKALGTALLESNQPEDAEQALQQALALNPDDAELYNTLGKTVHKLGRPEETVRHLEKALALKPDFEQPQLWITKFLVDTARYTDALLHLEKALKVNPGNGVLLTRKAHALQQLGRFSEGLEVYRELYSLYPNDAASLSNLANTYRSIGRFEEAEAAYRKAIDLMPDNVLYYSNYLQSLHYNPAHDAATIHAAHLEWDERFQPQGASRARATDLDPQRRLRVGMISAGFRAHPVGQMITSALEHVPRSDIELFTYTMHNQVDVLTERMQRRCDHWQSVTHLSDSALADQIRHDGIDILLDLCGHTEGNRTLTMAMEPAPLQIKWVGGQINTTGLSAMDYMLSDSVETPPGVDAMYVEKLIRLPDDYICFMPRGDAPAVDILPAHKHGHITFGCFNNPSKINPVIIEHWARILEQVAGSRLFLKGSQYNTEEFIERLSKQFEALGITRERLIFEGQSPHLELLDCYNRVDIALDPWPYSGGLTTCEALLMGVPVITYPGPTFAGRHSATHLTNAGLPELVATDWEHYASLAVSLAADLDNLATIRRGLRRQLKSSPVCDYRRFARHLNISLRAVWQRYCEGKAPAALTFSKDGQARFEDETEPVLVDVHDADTPRTEKADGEMFTWSLPRRVVTIDSGGKLFRDAGFDQLRNTNAFSVIGFDPASRIGNSSDFTGDDNVQLFPHAVLGDGRPASLHACLNASLSSVLKPLAAERLPDSLRRDATILTSLPINTIALDAIEGPEQVDWLILDEHCNTLAVLEHGRQTLHKTLLLQVRVLFQPRYENQASMGDITAWAEENSFSFYRMNDPRHTRPGTDISQALDATRLDSVDLLFIPDDSRLQKLDTDQRQLLAFLLHTVFGIRDLCLHLLQGIDNILPEDYLKTVAATPTTTSALPGHTDVPMTLSVPGDSDTISGMIDRLLRH